MVEMMSEERKLIKDMKILLECTDMGGLQRQADVLIGRAVKLLAQPDQEPVAWMYDWKTKVEQPFFEYKNHVTTDITDKTQMENIRPLYIAPPKPDPLGAERLKAIAVADEFLLYCNEDEFIDIARAIEKAHGISI